LRAAAAAASEREGEASRREKAERAAFAASEWAVDEVRGCLKKCIGAG
jgi:hypothetical protein